MLDYPFSYEVRRLELPVLWLEQYPKGLGPTIPEVADLLGDQKPLAKTCFSAFGLSDFRQALRETGRRQILLAGIETHICVYQTARDLLDNGFYVEVVADAVSSRTAQNKAIGLEKILHCGAQITDRNVPIRTLARGRRSGV